MREIDADLLLNEGQQLAGAAVLAKNDGLSTFTQEALIAGSYINGNISGWTFSATAIPGTPAVADDPATTGVDESAPAVPAQAGYVFTDASVTAGVCEKLSDKTNSSKITCDAATTSVAYAF